jgi:hypothetical protein
VPVVPRGGADGLLWFDVDNLGSLNRLDKVKIGLVSIWSARVTRTALRSRNVALLVERRIAGWSFFV